MFTAPDQPGGGLAIHFGHLQVHQDKIDLAPFQDADGFQAAPGADDAAAVFFQAFFPEDHVEPVVVHEEHERRWSVREGGSFAIKERLFHRDGQHERAADAGLTFHADGASEQVSYPPAERETYPDSLVLFREGLVDLIKTAEDLRLLFGRNSDARVSHNRG